MSEKPADLNSTDGAPRRKRLVVGLLVVGLLGCVGTALVLVGRLHFSLRRYYGLVDETRAKIELLHGSRPADVPKGQWERAVDWTSNLICQVYFGPEHGDVQSLERLCHALDGKLAAKANLNTLRWVWEQCELAKGLGQIYAIEFRDVRLLTEPPITDDSLENLWSSDKCSWLDLTDTQVTDAGMTHLATMPELRKLDLDGTRVTDAGLLKLAACPRIEQISVVATGVTAEGVAEFGRHRPTIRVRREEAADKDERSTDVKRYTVPPDNPMQGEFDDETRHA